MSQIIKKFIGDDQVGAEKILLENNSSLRANNAADAPVDLLKLDAADKLLLQQSLMPASSSIELGELANAYQEAFSEKFTVTDGAGAEMGGILNVPGIGFSIGSPTQDVNLLTQKADGLLNVMTGDQVGGAGSSPIIIKTGNTVDALAGSIEISAGVASGAGANGSVSIFGEMVSFNAVSGVELANDTALYFRSNSTAFYAAFKPSTAMTANAFYTLPPADGDDGQVLKTNGAGVLSWTDNMVSLANDQFLVAENAAGTGTVNIIKVDTSDHIEMGGDLYMADYQIKQVSEIHSDTALVVKADAGDLQLQASAAIELQSGSGLVKVQPSDAAASSAVQFFDGAGAHSVAFKAPEALAGSSTYVLPVADGTDGQVLKTNGSGQLAWYSIPVQKVWARETGNIDGSDQVTLAHAPIAASLIVFVSGVMMRYGVDYEVDATVNTKLNFNLPGGAPPIVAADDIYIQYQY